MLLHLLALSCLRCLLCRFRASCRLLLLGCVCLKVLVCLLCMRIQPVAIGIEEWLCRKAALWRDLLVLSHGGIGSASSRVGGVA